MAVMVPPAIFSSMALIGTIHEWLLAHFDLLEKVVMSLAQPT